MKYTLGIDGKLLIPVRMRADLLATVRVGRDDLINCLAVTLVENWNLDASVSLVEQRARVLQLTIQTTRAKIIQDLKRRLAANTLRTNWREKAGLPPQTVKVILDRATELTNLFFPEFHLRR